MQNKTPFIALTLSCFILLAIAACNSNHIFEQAAQIAGNKWDYRNKVVFNPTINDTISNYTIYLTLRINGNYRYSNLFVLFSIKTPGGDEDEQQLEFKLAEDDGTWTGSGLGDIYSYRIPVAKAVRFPLKGSYSFSIKQIMRDDMLENIEDVGIIIEKLPATN